MVEVGHGGDDSAGFLRLALCCGGMTYVAGTLSPAVEIEGVRFEYEVKRLGAATLRVAVFNDWATAHAVAAMLSAAEGVPR